MERKRVGSDGGVGDARRRRRRRLERTRQETHQDVDVAWRTPLQHSIAQRENVRSDSISERMVLKTEKAMQKCMYQNTHMQYIIILYM